MTPPADQGSDRFDILVLLVVALVAALGVVVWLTGEMAALLRFGRWPAVSPDAVPAILARLPSTPGRPADAWPLSQRARLPTGLWWYVLGGTISLAAMTGIGIVVVAAARAVRTWDKGGAAGQANRTSRGAPSRDRPVGASPLHRHVGGAHWAGRPDIGSLRVRRAGGGRLVLGRVGRSLVATEARHSVLVLGPTQSGKTTALAIPALLEWDGPVIATSVKDDLVADTRAFRATLGRVWVFDPTGSGRVGGRSQWSPLAEASTWSGAQRVAQALVGATPSRAGVSDGAFWFAASAKLLAPLLLAAQRGERPMSEVVRWTNLQETDEVRVLLEVAGETEAVQSLVAGVARDERIRSSIYTTLETVLAPYEDPVVAESAGRSDIDPATLLQGSNTLYLCGPSHEQARVQGVFSALIGSIVHTAVKRYEGYGPLDPPLLVVLDEAANIAPLQELDQLASTGAGMGIQLVTVCQDLAQLTARYGPDRARSIANNHRAKVALSGIADVGTLDTLSGLAGEQALREQTITNDHDGRRTTSSSVSYRRLARADELRCIRPGHGVLIYGHLPPARLALRPWYRDAELRRRVELPAPAPLNAWETPSPRA